MYGVFRTSSLLAPFLIWRISQLCHQVSHILTWCRISSINRNRSILVFWERFGKLWIWVSDIFHKLLSSWLSQFPELYPTQLQISSLRWPNRRMGGEICYLYVLKAKLRPFCLRKLFEISNAQMVYIIVASLKCNHCSCFSDLVQPSKKIIPENTDWSRARFSQWKYAASLKLTWTQLHNWLFRISYEFQEPWRL